MNTKNYVSIESLEARLGPMTVGLFIKAFRQADGFSQTEYAKKLKISKANLCDIEKGRKLVSPNRAAKIAKALKVPETLLLKLSIQDSLRQAKLIYQIELRKAS
jgi:transcriptional regulator with XRE-family HTH domain